MQAFEELTYDYRFCGLEQLPCNCGASTCRGMVNERRPQSTAISYKPVPLSRVKPFEVWSKDEEESQQRKQDTAEAEASKEVEQGPGTNTSEPGINEGSNRDKDKDQWEDDTVGVMEGVMENLHGEGFVLDANDVNDEEDVDVIGIDEEDGNRGLQQEVVDVAHSVMEEILEKMEKRGI